ncbi:flavin-containing monooxygenase [Piscinibacter sakaiensis]|uniref:flavin-containing monooxygenase n=1 Tax=Piscinibacter sakaiensis TaxID=1547922 RepID=UPI003AAE7E38
MNPQTEQPIVGHSEPHTPDTGAYDAVVIGAGFAGLYMLYRLRELGLKARGYETGAGVGGTWYWNRYPGARCDVESMQYSYSFSEELQQEWVWSERYPRQDEIIRYIDHVADRFELRPMIQLQTRVTSAVLDENSGLWEVGTDRGDRVGARFVISAAGCLSASRVPDLPGLASFSGKWYHTGNWPREDVDFSGKRVGVIGTGSSGIQIIPMLAKQAAQLTVFQRTPNFSIPAWNRPLPVDEQDAWKANFAEHRRKAKASKSAILYDYSQRSALEVDDQERKAEYDRRWARGGNNFTHSFNDLLLNKEANKTASDYVRGKIHSIVKDPQKAKLLAPVDHGLGTKRVCVDSDYYATYNLPHVSLVDLRSSPISEIVPDGVCAGSQLHQLDALVFATGYDAVTGALDRIDIRGRNGRKLKDEWADGPRTYLGLMSHGFPNLFFITGPQSPSILTNVIMSIEQHVEWIAGCLGHMQRNGLRSIEADAQAQQDWVVRTNELAMKTLFPSANSWFMGANIPGKPRVFLPWVGGFGNYTVICNEVVAAGYRGFHLRDAVNATEAAATS